MALSAPYADQLDENDCWVTSSPLAPGNTVHVGFTTRPRHVATYEPCTPGEW